MTPVRRACAAGLAALLCLTACSSTGRGSAPSSPSYSQKTAARTTRGHVVVVMMENRSYSDVVGNPAAPYLNSLAGSGTSFTDLHAIRHPSQPNYLALFSGSTHGVTDDSCPQRLTGPTLGSELHAAGLTFTGYSEGLPAVGSAACSAGRYARKHVPWTDFADLPASTNQPLTAFPTDYARLPTVSFVVPDLDDDMHDGSMAHADAWTQRHLGAYATWARAHGSLLVVTWDEDDRSESNRIPTIVVGAGVHPRQVSTPATLYSVLRAIEDRYRLPRIGASAAAPSLGLPQL